MRSLNLQNEICHDEKLVAFKDNEQFLKRFQQAKAAVAAQINSNFRRAFLSCAKLIETNKFGVKEGFKNSAAQFSIDVEAPLKAFEKEIEKLSKALEVEKGCFES